jgi:uncharacterized membrane protein
MMVRARDQSGQATLLVVGFTLVVFAIAGVAVDGARVWLLRRGLQGSADAAALSAAAQLDTAAFYNSGGVARSLEEAAATSAAREMLAARGIATRVRVVVREKLVRAEIRAELPTTFLSLIGVDVLPVAADATATPVFGEAP